MIKKTMLIVLCIFFLFSCGKKSDPEYKAKKNNIFITNIIYNNLYLQLGNKIFKSFNKYVLTVFS